ncbi:tRNA pseudouridine(55) synthase TruB [Nitriliruptoraceae bacterium ZYF776]|nr:tRNA pseudouridine(55) synthase TruB [Profundirhabdus halotolerans]
MGRRRRSDGPELDGVLLVDKPAGPTSHDVVQRVRRAAGQSRVGHTGTLDPAATGVLVVCLGRSTKLVRFLQAGTKTYAARMVLGVETASQDADGEVVARTPAAHVDERAFCEALTAFRGEIAQTPPMVSAVKVGGQRLHELARRGEEVEREARQVTVHDLVLDRFDTTRGDHPEASFLVTCSAGTYVRTLAHDVGRRLGVGGSLTALRRVANGPFTEDEAVTLDELEGAVADGGVAARLVDPATALARVLPVVAVDDRDLVARLTQGGRLPATGHDGPVAVRWGRHLVGVYRDASGEARPELVWLRPEELAAIEAPDAAPSHDDRDRR